MQPSNTKKNTQIISAFNAAQLIFFFRQLSIKDPKNKDELPCSKQITHFSIPKKQKESSNKPTKTTRFR